MAYEGFDKLKNQLAHRPGVTDPAALAAVIGRRKYGKAKMAKAAKTGTSLRNAKPKRG
jgi:hypothetical protein